MLENINNDELAVLIGKTFLENYVKELRETIALAMSPEDPDVPRYSLEVCLDNFFGERLDNIKGLVMTHTLQKLGVNYSDLIEEYQRTKVMYRSVLIDVKVQVFKTNIEGLYLQIESRGKNVHYLAGEGVRVK